MMGSIRETTQAGPQLPDLQQARKAAEDFEGLFLRTIVKSFRESTESNGEGMFGGSAGSGIKENWFDDAMSEHIAGTGGVGLAQRLVQDWGEAGRIEGYEKKAPPPLPGDDVIERLVRRRLEGDQ